MTEKDKKNEILLSDKISRRDALNYEIHKLQNELYGYSSINIISDFSNKIINEFCNNYHIERNMLLGKKRLRDLMTPRKLCIVMLRKIGGITLSNIGKVMSNRDHSGVLYLYNEGLSILDKDSHSKDNYNKILKIITK